ncbi:MAG: amino acid permease, partial [Deltaproteobacteria bacterium]|nr:amino acid permease [Deltaproteobacteria bacterium]
PMTDSTSPQLRRSLGFWALVFYGVGDILGAGIYALVGKVAGVAGSASWAAFAVALLVAGLTALTYAELGGRFPRSAGESFFTQQALGALVPELPQSVTVVGILLLLAAINFRGMRESSMTNIVATMVELTGLLIVIVAGAIFLSDTPGASISHTIASSSEVSWNSIARGAALGFFAFIGFEDMVNVAEEVKDPERNMPRAILIALVVTGLVYLLVVIVATTVVAPTTLAGSEAPLLTVVQRATDAVPDRLFTLIALFAVANTGLLNFIMGSRLIYGMSRQGLLPSALGAVHPKRQTPHLAILTVLAVALALALSGTLTYLAGTTSLLLLLVFFTVNLSLIAIKRRDRKPLRTFCAPRLIPLAGALSCLGLMPFVPADSLLTAGVILALGAGIVGLNSRRSAA